MTIITIPDNWLPTSEAGNRDTWLSDQVTRVFESWLRVAHCRRATGRPDCDEYVLRTLCRLFDERGEVRLLFIDARDLGGGRHDGPGNESDQLRN